MARAKSPSRVQGITVLSSRKALKVLESGSTQALLKENSFEGKLPAPGKPIPPIFEKHFWKIEDVAEYTGYAIGTLYNLVSKNLIPFKKKRGKLFFVPLEIQNWIEEGDTK